MPTVEDVFSACGGYRLVRIQEVRPDAIVQHAVLDRAADGAVLLDLTDPGCRVDASFFDAVTPGVLHLVVSRRDGGLLGVCVTKGHAARHASSRPEARRPASADPLLGESTDSPAVVGFAPAANPRTGSARVP